MYVCVCVFTRIHTPVALTLMLAHRYIHIHTQTHTHKNMYKRTPTHTHAHKDKHVHTFIHNTQTHIHTHTHIIHSCFTHIHTLIHHSTRVRDAAVIHEHTHSKKKPCTFGSVWRRCDFGNLNVVSIFFGKDFWVFFKKTPASAGAWGRCDQGKHSLCFRLGKGELGETLNRKCPRILPEYSGTRELTLQTFRHVVVSLIFLVKNTATNVYLYQNTRELTLQTFFLFSREGSRRHIWF
jgi:hypothetical protein